MDDNHERNDLRVIKTEKMLNVAMYSLLNEHTFRKITVRDICREAQISRATFYARFADKYDFLKKWLINLIPDGFANDNSFHQNMEYYNDDFNKNKTIIQHLITDADGETLEILSEFLLLYFQLIDKYDIKHTSAEQVVLSNFFAGGMIFYIFWQVKNRFPPEVAPMNIYLYELINKFKEWKLDSL